MERADPHRADIIASGSVLEPWFWPPQAAESYRGFIWGAGRMFAAEPMEMMSAKVLALRGEWTFRSLCCNNPEAVVLGEPGLLCGLFAGTRHVRFKLGLVPHWSEQNNPLVRELAARCSEIRVIDICDPFDEVIRAVSECEYILSSALHGLVLADSLGIPNEWLKLTANPDPSIGILEFKFRDYYSLFGLEDKGYVTLDPHDTLDGILSRIPAYSRPGIEAVQQRLLRSFPFAPLVD